jgi:hypothetical protein
VSSTHIAELPVDPSERGDGSTRGRWSIFDAVGLAAVVVAGVLVLVPALVHGPFIGPYDILQSTGLNKTPGVKVHNATLFDQISLFIPWTNLVWTQVHQGHLPLWNPYSALGMPLAFNWESAPLSFPVLVGYLVPVRLSYTVQVVVTVLTAGTGVYVLGKVLRLGTLGCMTAAIVFELSGAFMGNIGWPLASVWSWGGWVFAAIVLVLRSERRPRAIVFLSVAIAFAIYAGNPEDLALFALSAAVFGFAMLLFRAPALGGSGPVVRPIVDLGLSAIAGAALAAPLILPGLEFARGSNRSVVGPDLFPKGLPPRELVNLIFQGFDGLPLLHSQWFGLSAYEVTSAYVGVIVLVLAATALVVRWRKSEVRSFGLMAVATGLLVFAPPLVSFLDSAGARIYWIFAMTPMILAISVLSGIGMDIVVKSYSDRRVRRVLGIGFGAMAVLLGIVWLVGRRGLTPSQINIRSHSFVWPAVEVVVGLIAVWALSRVAVRARSQTTPSVLGAGSVAGSLLLLVTTGFLVVSGAPILSSSPKYPTSTPAVTTLQRTVGNSIVGMGTSPAYPAFLGVMVNANLLYNVQEFTAYDPLTPRAYFSLYGTPTSVLDEFVDILSPAITSTRAARLYGISYLLEPSGVPGPDGSDFVRKVGDEDLYRVPGAAAATLVTLRSDGSLPGKYAMGKPVRVTHPDPSAWTLRTRSTTPSVLRLRLTNVPGWQATIDGKPVDVSPFARTMLQVRVPAGRHVVALHYWPRTFSMGIVLALCAVAGLAILLILAWIRSRAPENKVEPV